MMRAWALVAIDIWAAVDGNPCKGSRQPGSLSSPARLLLAYAAFARFSGMITPPADLSGKSYRTGSPGDWISQ